MYRPEDNHGLPWHPLDSPHLVKLITTVFSVGITRPHFGQFLSSRIWSLQVGIAAILDRAAQAASCKITVELAGGEIHNLLLSVPNVSVPARLHSQIGPRYCQHLAPDVPSPRLRRSGARVHLDAGLPGRLSVKYCWLLHLILVRKLARYSDW